jgi:predicted HTH transcriptional regulator
MMTWQEFSGLIEGSAESQSLEFKGPCEWTLKIFLKTILAMSNLRDGGFIVVGIENGTANQLGLSPDQLRTFDRDVMMDQVAEFGEPPPLFDVDLIPAPSNHPAVGRTFLVIHVRSFEMLPVICRKNGDGIKKGDLFFRNSNGRPQSAAVSSVYDMEKIVDLSISRRLEYFRNIGITPPLSDVQPTVNINKAAEYDKELNGL